MNRPFAGLYQDKLKAKPPMMVAIPRNVMDVSFEAAWKMLDVVEHTEETIERVLRRELNALFGRWRRPARRSAVRRPAPHIVRL
jgi:hypothetical protein